MIGHIMSGDADAVSRRSVLKAAGVTVAAGAGAGAFMNGGAAASSEWSEVSTPISKTLNDVVYTADGPYAAGEGGYVLGRTDGSWQVEIESGPSASNNPLTGIDVTDDGKRVYFCGGSGALGAYDVLQGKKYDYSAPEEKTSTWEDVAVSGQKGSEKIIVANGSGETFDAVRTEDSDGNNCLKWGEVTKPAGGSTIPGITFASDDPQLAYAIDTSQQAVQSTDHNDTWENIGVTNAEVAFSDVVGSTDVMYVAGGGGTIYRRDCDCNNWTPIDAGENGLKGIDRSTEGDGESVIASANGGLVYERTSDGWAEMDTPVTADLTGVAYPSAESDQTVDVAVGSSGTIVERQ